MHYQYKYIIPENLNNQRIDKAITDLCKEFSRSQVQKAIKLRERHEEMEAELAEINARIENTKDKTEKQFLIDEAAEIEPELATLKVKADEAMDLAKVMQVKTDKAEENAELAESVMEEVKNTAAETITKLSDVEKASLERVTLMTLQLFCGLLSEFPKY